MSGHVGAAGGHRRPDAARDAVARRHDRAAARRARVRRRSRSRDALDMRRARRRAPAQVDRRRSRRGPRRRSTCCSPRPTPRRSRASRTALGRGAAARAVRRRRLAAIGAAAWPRSGRGSAAAGRAGPRRSSDRPSTRRSPRELADAIDHARRATRAACCRCAVAPARGSSRSCRDPADLTPADTSSLVAPGLGRRAAPRPPRRRRDRRRAAPGRRAIAAVRERAPARPMSSSSARSTAIASRRSWRSSARSPRPGRRPSRSRCADAVGRRGATRRRHRARHVLDPAAILGGAGGVRSPGGPARPGRLPVHVATPPPAMTPPRRDPRTA